MKHGKVRIKENFELSTKMNVYYYAVNVNSNRVANIIALKLCEFLTKDKSRAI